MTFIGYIMRECGRILLKEGYREHSDLFWEFVIQNYPLLFKEVSSWMFFRSRAPI